MNPCGHWNGAAATHCGAGQTSLYIQGWLCAGHTPAAVVGEPEPDRSAHCAPARCLCGECPWWTPHNPYALTADSWVTDARNIASGKRRASLSQQASAKVTVAEQRAREQAARKAV